MTTTNLSPLGLGFAAGPPPHTRAAAPEAALPALRLAGSGNVPGWQMGAYGTGYLKSHPWTTGNRVDLLTGQQEWTAQLLADIKGAKRVVNIAQYNWEADAHGRAIVDALKEAAARNVEVNVIVDRFGSHTIRGSRHPLRARKLVDEMRAAGINVSVYYPPYKLNPYKRELYHPKFARIDDIAHVAGMGFGEKYATWNDLALRIEGPAAAQAGAEYAARMVDLGAPLSSRHRALLAEGFHAPVRAGWAGAKLVANSPGHRLDATADFLQAARQARERLWVMTPYIGDPLVVDALNEAASRGVDVRVLSPGPKSRNNKIQVTLSRSFYADLAPGVKMFELDEMMHAKAWLSDGRLTVGSTNLSAGSLRTYWELSAAVEDARAAAKYGAAFEQLQAKAGAAVQYADIDTRALRLLTAVRKLTHLRL